MENLKIGLHGAFALTVKKADGTLSTTYIDNIIVNGGFDLIAGVLGDNIARPGLLSHIAVGTNNTVPAVTDTILGTEVSRVVAAYAHTIGTKTFSMESTFTGLTSALTEAGMFNDPVNGVMFDRVVFPVINLQASDTLVAKFILTMS